MPQSGVRLPDDTEPHMLRDGEYCLYLGKFYLRVNGMLANLGAHEVEEHADRSITVRPSILVTDGCGGRWHGFLERGKLRVVE